MDGARQLPDRLCLVNHNCRDSVWKAVFQDCKVVTAAIWSGYCSRIRARDHFARIRAQSTLRPFRYKEPPELMFADEIDCSGLFDGDQKRERILVFEIC